jgi:hypothetical protein
MRLWVSLVALAAVVALAGCGGAKPGTVVESNTAIAGRSASVSLPSGDLTVWVGKPVKDVGDVVGGEPSSVDGGRYVGVSWSFDQRVGGPAVVTQALAGQVKPMTVRLVADGRAYDVGSVYDVVADGRGIRDRGKRSAYVAVKGDPKRLWLEVTYDGLTQRISYPAGKVWATRASALKDLKPAGERACDADGTQDREGLTRLPLHCVVGASTRLPYVAGLGWAKDGHEWAVVDVTSGISGIPEWKRPDRPGRVRYVVFRREISDFTVNGQHAVKVLRDTKVGSAAGDDAEVQGLLVYDVAAQRPAQLDIHQRFELAADNVLDADLADKRLPQDAVVDLRRHAAI